MNIKNLSQKKWIILAIIIMFFIFLIFSFYSSSNKETSSKHVLNIKDSKYTAAKEIALAFENLKGQRQEASVIEGINTKEKVVAITFDDLTDDQTMEKILELLDSYSAKVTFFIPGIKGAENPKVVKNIIAKKQEIGNYTLAGLRKMEKLSDEELVTDFCRSRAILKDISGKAPTILKCNATKYTKELLEVANACGINSVVKPTHLFNYQSFSSYEMTLEYLRKMKKGSIISIKVKGYLGPEEYKATKKEETPSINKEASIKKISKKDDSLKEQERLLQVVKWVLRALEEIGYKTEFVENLPDYNQISPHSYKLATGVKDTTASLDIDVKPSNYQELRQKNEGRLSKIVNNLYTTQPAISYIFRGISNKATVDDILAILDSINAKATFFVTGKEIMSYPDTVSSIVSKGHSLGNGGYGMNINNPSSLSYNEISYEIEMGERILKAFLGKKYSFSNKYYMPLYADTDGLVLEAASALGYTNVITYNRNPILSSYKDSDANTILDKYYKNIIAFHRGDIVYFRLDYLTQPGAIEELVFKTADRFIQKSNYNIIPINQLITSPLVYVPTSRGEGVVSNLIKPSYNYDQTALNNLVVNNYIGNPNITTAEELIGFSPEEIENIDTTGKINTKGEKVIFLTFDDWGSDIAISRLLSVLNKYDVKASFFIRVGNDKLSYESDMLNPNLLRAIALEGHDIASHTFSHTKINITTEEEKELLQKDIVTAHREMARYIGDTDALKPFFRPPTLAVSKLGINTVFDTGYSYIINGDFSTQDYSAPSLDFLVDRLKNGINTANPELSVTSDTSTNDIRKIEPGSIVVMHMSDESKYTPDALDIVIPYFINHGYKFDKLSNYLNSQSKCKEK